LIRQPGRCKHPLPTPHRPIDSNKSEKPIPHPAFLGDGRGPGAQLR